MTSDQFRSYRAKFVYAAFVTVSHVVIYVAVLSEIIADHYNVEKA